MVHQKEILICNPRPKVENYKSKNKERNILLKKIELLSKYSKSSRLSNKQEIYLNHNLTKILKELGLLSTNS